MPVYEYFCPENQRTVEVFHGMNEKAETWGQLCKMAKMDPGKTDPNSEVERLLFPPQVATPQGDSDLKSMGFTKLVKRDKGVYENVTRTGNESRYMEAGKDGTLPDLKKKIKD